ncbi:MAG: hypothetical protein AAF581_13760 [Planctomycetota bacterium]
MRRWLICIALLPCLLLPACAVRPPVEFRDGPQVTSAVGTYQVHYQIPDPIPLNEPFSVAAWIATPNREVDLSVDAAMPHHHHGMNQQPRLRRSRDGSYTADGMLFHMPGDWEIYFDVTDGAVTERAQISVEIE